MLLYLLLRDNPDNSLLIRCMVRDSESDIPFKCLLEFVTPGWL